MASETPKQLPASAITFKTPKQLLYELYSANHLSAGPIFDTVRVGGGDHCAIFSCQASCPPLTLSTGQSLPGPTAEAQGIGKKHVEHMAAATVLGQLRDVKGLVWPEEHIKMPVYETKGHVPATVHEINGHVGGTHPEAAIEGHSG